MPLTPITSPATVASHAYLPAHAEVQSSASAAPCDEPGAAALNETERFCERLSRSRAALGDALAGLEALAAEAGISGGTVSVRIFRSPPRPPKAGEHAGVIKDALGNPLHVLIKAESDAAESGDESDLLPLIQHVAPALIDAPTAGLLPIVFGPSYPPPRTLDDMHGLLRRLEDFVDEVRQAPLEPAAVAHSGLRRILALDDDRSLPDEDAASVSGRSGSVSSEQSSMHSPC